MFDKRKGVVLVHSLSWEQTVDTVLVSKNKSNLQNTYWRYAGIISDEKLWKSDMIMKGLNSYPDHWNKHPALLWWHELWQRIRDNLSHWSQIAAWIQKLQTSRSLVSNGILCLTTPAKTGNITQRTPQLCCDTGGQKVWLQLEKYQFQCLPWNAVNSITIWNNQFVK